LGINKLACVRTVKVVGIKQRNNLENRHVVQKKKKRSVSALTSGAEQEGLQ